MIPLIEIGSPERVDLRNGRSCESHAVSGRHLECLSIGRSDSGLTGTAHNKGGMFPVYIQPVVPGLVDRENSVRRINLNCPFRIA